MAGPAPHPALDRTLDSARRWRCAQPAILCVLLSLCVPAHAQSGVGTIRGRVRLATTAPSNPVIRMGADPACSQLWPNERPTQEFVKQGADGQLANVFVRVQGKFAETAVPQTPVVLDQHGCLYHPHVVGLRAGQALEIRNGDPTMHNVHSLSNAGNDFNASRPAHTAPLTIVVAHPELMLRLTCDVHSWMNIFVAVMSHPYFAVTGADGRFEIGQVPSGHHRLQIWHERYGPQEVDVDVSPDEVRDVNFTYAGTEKPAQLPASSPLAVPSQRSLRFVAAH